MIYIGYIEEWKTINNFKNIQNNLYEVSNFGYIRNKKDKTYLKMKIANKKHHPYFTVYLKNNKGKKEWILVHQLVSYSFLKIPSKYNKNDDLVTDHLDNNGLNNFYLNLEIKTRSENIIKAHKEKEINNKCENNINTNITNELVHQICGLLEKDKTYDEIIKKLNLPNTTHYHQLLTRIKNRLAWNEISKNYNFNNKKYSLPEFQKQNIKYIQKINEYIKMGKSNSQICDLVFPGTEKRESKMITIRNIRNKKIFKEYL